MRGLKGKIGIVAGAAPGNIGGATAFRLAQEGMKVIAAFLVIPIHRSDKP